MPQSAMRCTVLFVDDEPHVLGGLRDALRKYPFSISEVKRNLDGAILLDDIADIDELVRQIERQNH